MLKVAMTGVLYQKIGARPLVITGSILFGVSFWQLSQLTVNTITGDLTVWLLLNGLATTIVGVSAQTLSTARLNGATLTKATSLLYATRLLVGLLGSTIFTTLFMMPSRLLCRMGDQEFLGLLAGHRKRPPHPF